MKMADNYIHFETNNVRPLVEHLYGISAWEEKKWGILGSSSTAINLDDIDGGNQIAVDKDGDKVLEYHFILPITDMEASVLFQDKCATVGIEVEIITYNEAIVKWNELKALKPVAEAN